MVPLSFPPTYVFMEMGKLGSDSSSPPASACVDCVVCVFAFNLCLAVWGEGLYDLLMTILDNYNVCFCLSEILKFRKFLNFTHFA